MARWSHYERQEVKTDPLTRPLRNHRVKKPTQESDNTTFSGGEDNGDSRSHLSHDSAPSHTPQPRGQTPSEAGPSRKRPRASEDGSGPEADSCSPTPPLRRHKEGPGSEIELVFRPHPQLVNAQDYNQTRSQQLSESVFVCIFPLTSVAETFFVHKL